jgi:3-keto-L-gulonate-6-phosphate decarboxylase
MSDGIKRMYEDAYEAAHKAAVERIKNKDPEELYLLLKDLQNDIQHLGYDDSLQLTRNQWSTFSRIQAVMKDLMK